MISVVILGSGNVAQHLVRALKDASGIAVKMAYARTPQSLKHLLPDENITDDFSKLPEADIYIISVSDDAIHDVSTSLPFSGRLVVHTSGTKSIEELDAKNRRGVFYPLQTFSKSRKIDYSQIPLCLEAEENDMKILEAVASAISKNHYHMDSQKRKALHVAAVFVSNFVNHMYVAGESVASDHDIPFEVLKPLILETAQKVQSMEPAQAQTGPSIRNDQGTIAAHKDFLQNSRFAELYEILTKSIQNEQKL
jgi:predicted short-subunit dehydrogenase-like oxidoreductase (DUF2520 family)